MKTKKEYSLTLGKDKDGNIVSWHHPGGKLIKLGSGSLSDTELLAVIIGSGAPGISAMKIAEEIMKKFGSYRGISGHDIEEFLKIKGLDKAKCARLAAAWEIAGRIVKEVLKDREKND